METAGLPRAAPTVTIHGPRRHKSSENCLTLEERLAPSPQLPPHGNKGAATINGPPNRRPPLE